jgi:hypothetical protein
MNKYVTKKAQDGKVDIGRRNNLCKICRLCRKCVKIEIMWRRRTKIKVEDDVCKET